MVPALFQRGGIDSVHLTTKSVEADVVAVVVNVVIECRFVP